MLFLVDSDAKTARAINATTFAELRFRERHDLQEWVTATPRLLGEELFIVTTEFAGFDRASERLDVLALDVRGKLVVVELKRSAVGTHAELQALRYAAYCSTLTLDDLAELHVENLARQGSPGTTREEALELIRAFVSDPTFTGLDDRPRIILAAEEFPAGMMATVMWLRGFDVDVSCVRLRPHRVEGSLVIDSSVLIPLPEAEEFLVRRERKEAGQASTGGGTERTRAAPVPIDEYAARLTPRVRPMFDHLRTQLNGRGDVIELAWKRGVSYRRASDETWITWIEATTTELRAAIPPESHQEQFTAIKLFGTWPLVSVSDMSEVDEIIRILAVEYEKRYRTLGSPQTVTDYYVAVGEGPHRTWADFVRYGYVSAGGGPKYSGPMLNLHPGTRIFAHIPKVGYVGVGTVLERAVPVTEFVVRVDGRETLLPDAPLTTPKLHEYTSPEKMEHAVRVEWLHTREKADAVWEKGMFANQNTACRLADLFTLETLVQQFGLDG
jgi:hypothetical protein